MSTRNHSNHSNCSNHSNHAGRRTFLASLGRAVVMTTMASPLLTACASPDPNTAFPPGWERARMGAAVIPVPSGWEHAAVEASTGTWSEQWSQPQGTTRLMAGRLPGTPTTPGADNPLEAACTSLAELTLNFQAATHAPTQESMGEGRTLTHIPWQSATPGALLGHLWVIGNGEETVALALLDEQPATDLVDTISQWFTMAPSNRPVPSPNWQAVSAGNLHLWVPATWVSHGTTSSRWDEGWSDAGLDGAMHARLLVASTISGTLIDAVAQIEADSIAGALPGYQRTEKKLGVPPSAAVRATHPTPGARTTPLRGTLLRYTYTPARSSHTGEGILWACQDGHGVSALQLSFAGPLDEDLTATITGSITMDQEES